VSPFSHPFFTSVFPGCAGLALGLAFAAYGSATGSHSINLGAFLDDPNIDQSRLDHLRTVNLLAPWLVCWAGAAIGIALMFLQRRLLRRHAWFLSSVSSIEKRAFRGVA